MIKMPSEASRRSYHDDEYVLQVSAPKTAVIATGKENAGRIVLQFYHTQPYKRCYYSISPDTDHADAIFAMKEIVKALEKERDGTPEPTKPSGPLIYTIRKGG